jgi:D-xylose 1-dehydrogenase (NADP+, D-xylono-1,5-lactone-forming)
VVRWGILSTARVGEEFVRAVRENGRSVIQAVGSRDASRAEAWAARLGVDRSFGSYSEVIESEDVDAVYVPLPNSLHAEWAIRSLQAGKHVLVEKPMALRAEDVDRIFEAARRAKRVVMEGFMFRHHPLIQRVIAVAESDVLGEIVTIRAWHGFTVEDLSDIRLDPALGGGALLDLGCYCVAGTLLVVAGLPDQVGARQILDRGADVSTYAELGFHELTAVIDCSMKIPESAGLHIVGTQAQIEVPQPWFPHLASEYWLVQRDGRREVVKCEPGDSYALQVGNFCDAVAGVAEPAVSPDLSHRVASTLEMISASAVKADHTSSSRLS